MKKTVLICWNSKTFVEVVVPLLRQLSDEFRIVILLSHDTKNKIVYARALEELKLLRDKQTIEQSYTLPFYSQVTKVHLFMRAHIKELQGYRFDCWLTNSEIQPFERYIADCVLSQDCITVCFWHNVTYVLQYHQDMAKKLLFAGADSKPLAFAEEESEESPGGLRNIIEKIRRTESVRALLKKIGRRLYTFYEQLLEKRFLKYYSRVVLPWLMVRKTFPLGPYDKMTQMSSGNGNVLIFCDEFEAQIHRLLLNAPDVYVARYPSSGACRCDGKEQKTAILSLLSGWEEYESIPEEILSLYCREFKTVLSETGALSIDLRPHPDFGENGDWSHQLRNYLNDRGVPARVVGRDRPIRDQACNYLGVAGFASAALRDARASCDYALIIGFVSVSERHFRNPQFVFGKAEGIGWIESDGSYDPEIFVQRRCLRPRRQTVPEIMKELSKRGPKQSLGANQLG